MGTNSTTKLVIYEGETLKYKFAIENSDGAIDAARIPALGADGKLSSTFLPSSSGITAVSGVAPISSSGGTSPSISISAATTSAAGSMSAADKTKLDGIEPGATAYTHPTGDGSLHVPATGTTNNGKVLKAGATAGSLSWGTLTASDVGAASSTHNHSLDSLSNVTITANASGEILKWNGTAWVNNTLAEAGIQAAGSYQPLDADLTAIAGIAGTSGLLKKTAADTWTLDTNSYLPTSGGAISGMTTYSLPNSASGTSNAVNTLQLFQSVNGADAFQTFHIAGDVAVHFGLDGTTNDLFVGGWSFGANKYKVYHANNLTNLNQLTNGPGYITSSGSISGNAATATKLATARTINGVAFDGTANITLAAPSAGSMTVVNGGSTNFTASAGNHYLIWTGSQQVTLPASPSAGDTIYFTSYSGSFTILKNGKYIMGINEDLTVDMGGTGAKMFSFGLRFVEDSTNVGWVLL